MRTAATAALAAALLALPLMGRQPAEQVSDTVGRGEFPGLQFLPPGSTVSHITLPRYEKHRLTSLAKIARLCVETRDRISLQGITATLFSPNGYKTTVTAQGGTYNFKTRRAESTGNTAVKDERFSARGGRVVYDSGTRKGVMLGPVRSSVSAAMFSHTAKPAPQK